MVVCESAKLQMTSRTIIGTGCPSKRATRLVAAAPCTDRDHRQALGAGDGLARGSGVEAEDHRRVHRHLLAVDPVDAAAADHHVHLFLLRVRLVVLDAFGVRRQLETVDAKRLAPELATEELHRSGWTEALDVGSAHDGLANCAAVTSSRDARGRRAA